MRNTPNVKIDRYRIHDGRYGSASEDGNNGVFVIERKAAPDLKIMASDGTDDTFPELAGWEHVSVSTASRCPTWEEMCLVKELFWQDDEVVYQLHPAKCDWVNYHRFCLHLWRFLSGDPPLPPKVLVGPST